MKYFFAIFLVIFFCAQTLSAQILPHSAKYAVSLGKRSSGNEVIDAKGELNVVFQQNCESWLVHNYSSVNYIYSNGTRMPVSIDSTFAEQLDGTMMQFASNGKTSDVARDFVRGTSSRTDHSLVASYENNDGHHDASLSKNILFPMEHTERILAAAEKGEQVFYASVFDGTEEHLYFDVNTVISKPYIDAKNKRYWRISMAFFGGKNNDVIPSYEMYFNLYETGVIDDIDVVYDKMTLHHHLIDLKLLEIPVCH